MIHGHTLDALLLPALESTPGFTRYNWYRGLVSVSFLLVAGVAYYLATLRRFDVHKADPSASRRRFRRGLDLILIGYALKLPWASLSFALTEARWAYFTTCGVLECIGITLIVLEIMTVFARRPGQVVGGAMALAVGLVVAAPFLDGLTPQGPLRPLLNFVSHQGGSPFPVAPWAAYMLGGVGMGAFVLPRGAETPLAGRILRLGALFAVSYVGWRVFKQVDFPFVTADTTYSSKPVALFDRMRGITLLLAGLAVVCHPVRRLPPILAVISGETLAVYVIHLVLLFHPPLAIASRLGKGTFELGPALVASLCMVVSTIALTRLWHEQKRRGWLRGLFHALLLRLRRREIRSREDRRAV